MSARDRVVTAAGRAIHAQNERVYAKSAGRHVFSRKPLGGNVTGLTYEERQNHPRRCTARRHDGEPCGKFATVGADICYAHGGWAPQVRRKGLLRKMVELDLQAQADAAFNVMLPPELHKLVAGGGRGNRKAPAPKPSEPPEPPEAPPEPAPTPEPQLPPLAGIATGPRRGEPALVIDVEEPPRRRKPAPPPPPTPSEDWSPACTANTPHSVATPPHTSTPHTPTPPTVPRLMTMEEAFEPPRRRGPRR